EIFNRGTSSVSLNGWSVQYAAATGTSWQKTDLTDVTLAPGQYYLIQEAAGAAGTTPLPTPNATGTIAMSGTAGKVALLNTNILIVSGTSCPSGVTLVDLVGFGTTANCFEGSGATPAPSNTNAVLRAASGCTDNNNNATDFAAGLPNPRNTATAINPCSGPPTLSVSVVAGINAAEPSTNGTLTINLSSPAPAGGITVTYSLSGTATLNTDYTNPESGTVTIAQNGTSATVNINVNEDPDIEGTETIQITLNSATSPATIGTASASINLNDNDLPPNPFILLVNTYSQDFNSLTNTGSSSTLPTGWLLNETGSAANTTYTAGTGSGTAGDTYSFGAASNTERAFGTLQSGSLIPTIGAQIQNNSGTSINRLKISYTGEQWRLGAESRLDKLSFQYSLNATSLTTGTWADVTSLDFVAPVTLAIGAKDGNAAGNKTSITYTIRDLSIPNGAVFLIRWNDFNASGSDDGLGVDDFTIEANPVDVTPPAIVNLTPVNGATNLPVNISASVKFNEDVLKGTGNIRIRRATDNSIYQTINITSGAVTVSSSTVNIALNPLEVNTAYYVEIDNGAITDLEGNPFAGISGNATWNFTTGINLYVANFQTCTTGLTDGFTQYSVTGAITWACTSFGRDPSAPAGTTAFPNGVQINGFANGTNVPNVDWLISPSFNLTGANFPLLSFWSRTAFNGQPLQLKVSTNYVSGDPTLATWTDINGKFPSQTSNIWTLSENINLSEFKQPNVHFAFVYVSDDDEGARWTLDDISLGNSPTPPPPSITISTNDIQFAYAASGTTADKTFLFTGNDLTNNITLNATGVFSLSKDGINFSSSLLYTVAEANNITKTVYVRFAPAQNNQNFNGSISIVSGSLNAAINLTGSSIDPATTLEVVNWNIEWFGSASMEPVNDNLQEQNVKTILQSLNADVYALSEIVSEARLANVVSMMPGYSYVISNYGSHTNTTVNPPTALAEAQKLAFIYKTSVLSNLSTTALVSAGINTAADIANPAYNYFASGRFPFMLSADVTLNCITKNIKFVLVHGKANTSPTATSYDRRKRGSDTLHYTLQQNYANDNVIILGDYNDDLDLTITAGIIPPVTSYSAFTNDAINFSALTLPLSLAGKKSTVSFNDVIDHVTVSNDMVPYYIPATASILTDVTSLVSNYAGTTSDHYPVFTRYIFENKTAPIITNCPVVSPICKNATNTYSIPLFTATDDCDAVIYSFVISGATQRTGNTNNASGIFNPGTSIIAWTATDGWGNSVTCQATVVINSPTVSIPDAFALSSGVLPNTVYIGYAPASSITLTAAATGGTPSYSYNWSSGSTVATTTVTPLLSTVYSVTATDANGCTAVAYKTINVIDIRGGNKNDKVKICHNSNSLVVDGSSVITHLAHGDMLGTCTPSSVTMTGHSKEIEATVTGRIAVSVMPNPSAGRFTLNISSDTGAPLMLRVIDISGKVIERKNLAAHQTIKLGDSYHTGIYVAEITQGNEKKVFKLVKIQ
ncbi:MAG TPA: Ig-like domain-containing protein, partial [Flavitalea sp.]|nr:Ig-like domain-containing protein [Flavitalea sp.]